MWRWEATGVTWKPVWNILSDGAFALIVANAAHIRNVPGRKTDVNDATWIADLLACGLVRASFVPEPQIQELRALLRARTQLTREQTRHVQRLQKTLEEANIKLDSAITDILGVSGRRMVEAIIAGETNPTVLADLADRRIKAPREELVEALRGRVTDHHRFMLRLHLDQYDRVVEAIATIDAAVDAAITRMDQREAPGQASFRALILLLATIPGVGVLAATVILAEIGTDMSRFPTAGHLLSWAGFCPGQNQSAGKRRASKLRKGAPWLKVMLVQCAWAARRKKGSYDNAQFWRLRTRHGKKKAVCAVAASMLTAITHMLTNGTVHHDLGAGHFDRRPPEIKAKRLVGQLARLGFEVERRPVAKAA
jgi:transposase